MPGRSATLNWAKYFSMKASGSPRSSATTAPSLTTSIRCLPGSPMKARIAVRAGRPMNE